MAYQPAFDLQREWLDTILHERESIPDTSRPCGTILLVEHPPVITITSRPGAADHLLAPRAALAAAGIEVAETDRGGDITYHGPGQLVVYPILDLNLLKLRLHDYMRLLEASVIDTCRAFGVEARRDACATGVWVPQGPAPSTPSSADDACAVSTDAKICAMGVRIRRWVSMHGLALNVTTNLAHFNHIVPCGLAGRPVTSLERELGERCPRMSEVKAQLVRHLTTHLMAHRPTPAPVA
jgi:lipoyl(octanoyl) transferase